MTIKYMSEPVDLVLERLQAIEHDIKNGDGLTCDYKSCCPHHYDDNYSLHITKVDDGCYLYCAAGCLLGDILASLHLQLRDLIRIENNTFIKSLESNHANTCPKPFKAIVDITCRVSP